MPKTNNISTILEEFDKEFGSMFYLDLPDKNNPAVIAGTRKANTIKSFLRTSLTSLLEEMEVVVQRLEDELCLLGNVTEPSRAIEAIKHSMFASPNANSTIKYQALGKAMGLQVAIDQYNEIKRKLLE